jgi:membrane peptidoglycan carboxypeptidase
VLATALENGFSVKDSVDGTSPCTLHLTGKQYNALLRTQNAEVGGGVMSLRSATENSVNCAYFRLGAAVGLDKISEMAKRLGITHPINPANYSLSIGSSDGVSPLDMATAFSTFAADGVRHDPVFITKVEDSNGHVLFRDKGEGVRVLDPQIARTVTDVLRGVITRGTGTRAQLTGHVAAGKTGTTDSESDAWFVGYTPQLVTAVWMGDPSARIAMRRVGKFGPVFGGTWPATVWQKFMTVALDGQPELPFTPPDQKLWPFGKYVSENGRGKTSSSARFGTSSTTRSRPFGTPPVPGAPSPTTPATTPAPTTPRTVPTPPPGP